jgi:NIPSNAP
MGKASLDKLLKRDFGARRALPRGTGRHLELTVNLGPRERAIIFDASGDRIGCAVGSLLLRRQPCHLEDVSMIYEVRTYTFRAGTVPEFEERFAKRLPLREKHSKLGAYWHTEFGPLNQVIHVYPYDDLRHRTAVRAALAQDTAWSQLPGGGDLLVAQEAEIMTPAPFMHALGSRDYGTGNVYEMRTYTYAPGDIPKVLEAWAKAVPAREELSPLAACWTSELGGLNKFVHTWVYKDLNERARIREESRKPGRAWPPQAGVRPIRQENKLLIPAPFSPVR